MHRNSNLESVMDKYRMNKIQQPASLVQAINQRVSPVKQIPTIDDILQETKQEEFHGVRFNTVKQNIVQQSKIPHYSDTQHFKPIQPNLHYKPQDVLRAAPTQHVQQQNKQDIQSYESLALSQKPINPQPQNQTQNTVQKQYTPPQNNTQLLQQQHQEYQTPKIAPFQQKIGQQTLPSQQMQQNDMNSILEQRKQQILQQARIREQKRAMSVSAVNELTKSQNQILYQNKLQNQLNVQNKNNIITNKQESILNNKQLANQIQAKPQKVEVTFKVKQSPEKDETFESSTDILQSYRNLQVSAIPKEKKFNISENTKTQKDPFQNSSNKTERFKTTETNQINQNELFEADSPEKQQNRIPTLKQNQQKQQNEVTKQSSPTKITYVSSLNSDLDFLEERAFSAQQKKIKKSGAEELLEEENKMLKKIIKDNKPKINVMKIKQLEINANQLKKKIQMLEMEME
ncbi:Hypothetical_protein [Hexamita inflata]|uniref:Hypothetical_protein n=1 Tax=Hexamita inflata TaxID=28002 RepID=A0AA86UFZ0_9EUKA|nr:Hypothetical protein HINF_LOCUS44295 [Hexamita inflata]